MGPEPAHQVRATGDGEGTPPTGLSSQPGLIAQSGADWREGIFARHSVRSSGLEQHDREIWMSQMAAKWCS